MKPIIKVQVLSKQYRIGMRQAHYETLRESIVRAVRAPFKHLSRNGQSPDDAIWALKDVSFEVKPGEIIGIIGCNGAGKSTLLKILSRITEPTEGYVELYGRVGSLLEVGAGFHPELTGRENVYLNGAILGMKRAEIECRFDEIVAFAEIAKFLDTPIKHYSSGMYMRLAFAVAAHLEPEILLVDEVLAVGDISFQKKCLGKIGDVAKEGRTALFVSHNMAAIRTLCKRAILLDKGKLVCDENTVIDAIATYNSLLPSGGTEWSRSSTNYGSEAPLIFRELKHELLGEQPYHQLLITAELVSLRLHPPAYVAFDILDAMSAPLLQALPKQMPTINYSTQPKLIKVLIDLPPLIPSTYQIHAWVGPHYAITYDYIKSGLTFGIYLSPTPNRTFPHSSDHGYIVPNSNITIEELHE